MRTYLERKTTYSKQKTQTNNQKTTAAKEEIMERSKLLIWSKENERREERLGFHK